MLQVSESDMIIVPLCTPPPSLLAFLLQKTCLGHLTGMHKPLCVPEHQGGQHEALTQG